MDVDLINGVVALIGSGFVCRSILALHRHKQVRGVYWPVAIFFSGASTWSIYLFYEMDFIYSMCGNIGYASCNLVWLALAIFYRRN